MDIEEIKFSGIERTYFEITDRTEPVDYFISSHFTFGTTRINEDTFYWYNYFDFKAAGPGSIAKAGIKIRYEVISPNSIGPQNDDEYFKLATIVHASYRAAGIEFNNMCSGTAFEEYYFTVPEFDYVLQKIKAAYTTLFN